MQNLTPCQNNAISEIEAFLLSDEPELIITGPAGVGKSTVVNKVANDLSSVSELATILGTSVVTDYFSTATTNKAASIIDGVTIDKFLGLRTQSNRATGGTYRVSTNGSAPINNMLVSIDECGLIDTGLKSHIHKQLQNSKVIYVGDVAQLNPVGFDHSPVFDSGIRSIEMSAPVRQGADTDLYAECLKLRQAVLTKQTYIPSVNSQIRYISDDEAKNFMMSKQDNDRILTFTNKVAVNMGNYVRGFKGVSGNWCPDEKVISNGVLLSSTGSKIILTNEQEFLIKDVVDIPQRESFATYGVRSYEPAMGTIVVPVNPEEYFKAVKEASSSKNWSEMFRLKEQVADLRGSHACTIHKSQGSSYGTVMIHAEDLRRAAYDHNMFRRLLYVAVSRACNEVLIYGQL